MKSNDKEIKKAVEAERNRQKPLHNEGFAGAMEDMQNEKGLFLLITKETSIGSHSPWQLVENPIKSRDIISMRDVLSNPSIEYVEIQIATEKFRLFRCKDRHHYFLNSLFIPKSSKLNFNKPPRRFRKP